MDKCNKKEGKQTEYLTPDSEKFLSKPGYSCDRQFFLNAWQQLLYMHSPKISTETLKKARIK
jgi:hypothetical protein